ncbi:Mitochondrial RNA Methyltransferase [Abortiporus biennis]
MLRSLAARRNVSSFGIGARTFTSSSHWHSDYLPNAPLDLDPSYRELMKDVDMSVLRHKARLAAKEGDVHPKPPRELEIFPHDPYPEVQYLSSEELDLQDDSIGSASERKSPAASFGSRRIGAVILPLELQNTINRLIAESDKSRLHADAKRLFLEDGNAQEPEWRPAYDTKYKSWHQAKRHAERDGTAFASVALPSHYSVILAVFDQLKHRLGPDWRPEHIIDWGSGTGSGLWASLYAFQKPQPVDAIGSEDPTVGNTTISSYLGLDKRDGLVSIAKRLYGELGQESLKVNWQKGFAADNRITHSEGANVVALSAFLLSSLHTPLARKQVVKEMWESGAETIILIDHNTKAGFECIAEAREVLLRAGKKEVEAGEELSVKGSHVVAPCPHDNACPLYSSGSTRLHSGHGHEDTGYSYIVIRRGERPARATTQVGRVGDVGRRDFTKYTSMPTELVIDDGEQLIDTQIVHANEGEQSNQPSSSSVTDLTEAEPVLSESEMMDALRLEAYSWPRLVFPPMKKGGHIILDSCTAEAKIMRITIPKSQGKQPFYDARKSDWGDLFPHEPKNAPQERVQPQRAQGTPIKGADIGKRGKDIAKKARTSYGSLSDSIKLRSRVRED